MNTNEKPDTTNDNPDTQDETEQWAEAEQSAETTWPPPVPERPTGPHAPALVLGLVCVVIAGLVLAQELGSLSVDWGAVGPLGIVAAGAVLVAFGLVGLISSRRKATEP